MVTIKQKQRMLSYIVDKLSRSSNNVKANSSKVRMNRFMRGKKIFYDFAFDFVRTDTGLVLCMSKPFSYPDPIDEDENVLKYKDLCGGKKIKRENPFSGIYEFLKSRVSNPESPVENFAVVFYKDGKTFFRSAAEANYFKKKNELSLKNYTTEDMQHMILLRPEEIRVNQDKVFLQYYQPESARLQEGISTFRFEPVVFDYSHLEKWYVDDDKDSERLFIWTERIDRSGDLQIHDDYLKKAD